MANVAEFERWLAKKKTDYNYEFVEGKAVKKEPMKQNEFFIVSHLLDAFANTQAFKNKGKLLPEADAYIDEYRKRIPDLAYFTADQIRQAATGTKVVPAFVIELLSNSESYGDVAEKIEDYFRAGVQVIWYINPKAKNIYCYASAKQMNVFAGSDRITAAPTLPDFAFEVALLFEVP